MSPGHDLPALGRAFRWQWLQRGCRSPRLSWRIRFLRDQSSAGISILSGQNRSCRHLHFRSSRSCLPQPDSAVLRFKPTPGPSGLRKSQSEFLPTASTHYSGSSLPFRAPPPPNTGISGHPDDEPDAVQQAGGDLPPDPSGAHSKIRYIRCSGEHAAEGRHGVRPEGISRQPEGEFRG